MRAVGAIPPKIHPKFWTLLLASALSLPAQDWTPADTRWEVAWQVVNLADWSQTRQAGRVTDVRRTPDGRPVVIRFREDNPLLGRFPSKGKVDAYFLAAALAHFAVSRHLTTHRRHFQAATFSLSLACVANNEFRCGVHVRF